MLSYNPQLSPVTIYTISNKHIMDSSVLWVSSFLESLQHSDNLFYLLWTWILPVSSGRLFSYVKNTVTVQFLSECIQYDCFGCKKNLSCSVLLSSHECLFLIIRNNNGILLKDRYSFKEFVDVKINPWQQKFFIVSWAPTMCQTLYKHNHI